MNLCSSLENPVLNDENISVFALKMFLSQLKNVICGQKHHIKNGKCLPRPVGLDCATLLRLIRLYFHIISPPVSALSASAGAGTLFRPAYSDPYVQVSYSGVMVSERGGGVIG